MQVKKILSVLLLLNTLTAFAGTMASEVILPKWYVGVEAGGSVSMETNFQPVISYPRQTALLFAVPLNTDWHRDIGSSGLAGAFAGYQLNPNLALQFDYSYRGNYQWNVLTTEADSVFAPDIYDRFKADDISIQTFLLELLLKPAVNWGGFVPYVKGGIGAAYNTIDGLQNIAIPIGGNPLGFNLLVDGKSTTSFAWDAGLGADYYFNNAFSLGLGYRFVDAGKLSTSSSVYETVAGTRTTITPFEVEHIYLNEFLIQIAYHFG